MPKKTKKIHPIFICLLVILAVGLAGGGYACGEVSGALRSGGEIAVEIPKGASTLAVADSLKESGAIGSTTLFRLYSKLTGADGSYQYGSFTVNPKAGYGSIISALQDTAQYKDSVTVTIPEGYNAYQIGETLENAGLCTKAEFIEALNTHDFDLEWLSQISDNSLKMVKLDGFLFPDTYSFYQDEEVDSIILKFLRNFERRVLTEENLSRMEEMGLTLEDTVIFASIIQREAANVEEMYNVSSVFHNRMEPDSPYPMLESCTTNDYINNYIRKEYPGGNPSDELLAAYDTYGKVGFPVGAIANPGLDAIDAALHPNDTPYYFFVTDITYKHYYGRTYQEHLQNIETAKAVNLTYGKVGL